MRKNLNAKFSSVSVYQMQASKKAKHAKRAFHSLTGECIEHFIYLFGIECNCICSIDMRTGNIDIQIGDDYEPVYKENLYIKSISYKKNIYFISDRGNAILKFNPITNKKQYLYFEDIAMDYIPVLNNANLILLPVGYSEKLVQIDLENSRISYLPVNYRSNLIANILGEPYIFGSAIVVNQCCYRGSYVGPYIQKFHMDSGNFEYIKVKDFNHTIKNITFDGSCFWILSYDDGTLVCWDEITNKIVSMLDLAKETKKPQMTYAECRYHDGIIYILEEKGSCIIEIDIKEKTLCCFDCMQISNFELKGQSRQAFSEFIKIDESGTIYFLPYQSNGVISKSKAGNIQFYLTENSKVLEFAGEQQQNENICTLCDFSEIIQRTNPKKTGQADSGQLILNRIAEIL